MSTRTVRCGWCTDDLHDDCVVFVRVTIYENKKDKKGTVKEWQCKCDCQQPEGND